MAYFIQKTKWKPGKVVIIHTGPFEKREDVVERMTTLRKNKQTTLTIIEKE